MKKKCTSCLEEKEFSEYYSHPSTLDMLRKKCKICLSIYNNSRVGYQKKKDKYLLVPTPIKLNRKKTKPELKLQYIERFPEKYKAKNVSNKVKLEKGFHKHHWSYNEEHFMDFIILTIKQHGIAHRNLIYDQSERKYRTLDGEILDTKEKHLTHINRYL